MKHTANTLYITQPKSLLSKEGNTILVEQDGKKVAQLPTHAVGAIVCFGFGIVVTPPLMEHCAENGVSIAYLSESGRFLGRVEGPIKGNVLLRRQQHRLADNPAASLEIARTIVAAKVQNSRSSLTHLLRTTRGTRPPKRLPPAPIGSPANWIRFGAVQTLTCFAGSKGKPLTPTLVFSII